MKSDRKRPQSHHVRFSVVFWFFHFCGSRGGGPFRPFVQSLARPWPPHSVFTSHTHTETTHRPMLAGGRAAGCRPLVAPPFPFCCCYICYILFVEVVVPAACFFTYFFFFFDLWERTDARPRSISFVLAVATDRATKGHTARKGNKTTRREGAPRRRPLPPPHPSCRLPLSPSLNRSRHCPTPLGPPNPLAAPTGQGAKRRVGRGEGKGRGTCASAFFWPANHTHTPRYNIRINRSISTNQPIPHQPIHKPPVHSRSSSLLLGLVLALPVEREDALVAASTSFLFAAAAPGPQRFPRKLLPRSLCRQPCRRVELCCVGAASWLGGNCGAHTTGEGALVSTSTHQLLHDGDDPEGRDLPQVEGLPRDEVVDDVRRACCGGFGGGGLGQ